MFTELRGKALRLTYMDTSHLAVCVFFLDQIENEYLQNNENCGLVE